MQSQSERCVQRRPLKGNGEEKAVRKRRDGLIVVLELIPGRILREKDCVVTSRTDRATIRKRKTTGETQLIIDMLIKKEREGRRILREGNLRISHLKNISFLYLYLHTYTSLWIVQDQKNHDSDNKYFVFICYWFKMTKNWVVWFWMKVKLDQCWMVLAAGNSFINLYKLPRRVGQVSSFVSSVWFTNLNWFDFM